MTEYVGSIERQTLENTYFRQVLFTAQHAQLVVMCLRPGEEIGDEVHSNVDQFFRIEQGEAKFVFNEKKERAVRDGGAVVVPAGTYHNVVNTSKTAMLKLYTIHSPPNHADGMLNGRYDFESPYETAQRPLFDFLGSPPENKKHIVFEKGHALPVEDVAREILLWLDRYLGGVVHPPGESSRNLSTHSTQ